MRKAVNQYRLQKLKGSRPSRFGPCPFRSISCYLKMLIPTLCHHSANFIYFDTHLIKMIALGNLRPEIIKMRIEPLNEVLSFELREGSDLFFTFQCMLGVSIFFEINEPVCFGFPSLAAPVLFSSTIDAGKQVGCSADFHSGIVLIGQNI